SVMDNFMVEELLITVVHFLCMGMSWNQVASFATVAPQPSAPVGVQHSCAFCRLNSLMILACGCSNAISSIFCRCQVCRLYWMDLMRQCQVSEIWRIQLAWLLVSIKMPAPPGVFPAWVFPFWNSVRSRPDPNPAIP